VVENSDLELIDLSIQFGRGAPWHRRCRTTSRKPAHARDRLPRRRARDQEHRLKYRNLPGAAARGPVYGLRSAAAAWDSKTGRCSASSASTDTVARTPQDQGLPLRAKFRKLTVVVLDSDPR